MTTSMKLLWPHHIEFFKQSARKAQQKQRIVSGNAHYTYKKTAPMGDGFLVNAYSYKLYSSAILE